MAECKLIIKDTVNQAELILPVTPLPSSESGVSLEIINISKLGDIALPGNPTLSAPKLECLFPAQAYPFCVAAPLSPYEYIAKFTAWARSGTVLRLVWTNTSINIPVLVESVRSEERDGTGDVYATITMREHRAVSAHLQPVEVISAANVEPWREETVNAQEQSHTVVYGDTLWGICRKYYGDGSLYPQVAAYNSIKNPNLIKIGTVLKLPPIEILKGMKGSAVSTGSGSAASMSGGISYPPAPKGVSQRYSDRILAAKEKQMGF